MTAAQGLVVRLPPEVVRRLAGRAPAEQALRLVEEGLRMQEHPGVVFQDGPIGRRAKLRGGPDVWEVVDLVQATRIDNPGANATEIRAIVGENMGLTEEQVATALNYHHAHPHEAESLIAKNAAATAEGQARAEARRFHVS